MARHLPLWIVLLASFAGVPALAGEAEVARVKKEFPAALQKLEQTFNEVKAVGVIHYKEKRKGKEESRVERTALAKQGDLQKVVSQDLDEDGKSSDSGERVVCFSPQMSFVAKRRDAGSPYLLKDVQQPGSLEQVESFLTFNSLPPYSVFSTPFSRMMSDPSFKLGSVEPAGLDGRDLRISYQYYNQQTMLSEGWVEASPDDGWVIRKTWNRMGRPPAKAQIVSSVEYGSRTSGGTPLPIRATCELLGGWHEVCDFESITFEPTPEREFTAQFYGLPDLANLAKDPSSSSAPAWLFGLAGLALVVAVGMKVMAGRIARRDAAE